VSFGGRFTLDETGEPTSNAGMAFAAESSEAVRAFHGPGSQAGYREVQPSAVRRDRFCAAGDVVGSGFPLDPYPI
jgi:hypothetical protein